ncbi:hypothetical protein ACFXJ8_32380 [Nonomuraea sp. NPDC059194]|uniref:hypothetical protein n=1 Tax=Nonomuraea sp. NPDC059194 TaxID=3346764 RepID=UPI0036854BC4
MTQQKSGLVPGVLIGLVAMLVGAGVHGAVIGVTEYNLGVVAVLVGVLVGVGVTAVKPSSAVLPWLAALFGLVGAALGTTAGVVALTVKLAPAGTDYLTAVRTVLAQFDTVIQQDPVVVLFWVISAVAAFMFVNKRIKAVRAARAAAVPEPAAPPQEPINLFTPRNR